MNKIKKCNFKQFERSESFKVEDLSELITD